MNRQTASDLVLFGLPALCALADECSEEDVFSEPPEMRSVCTSVCALLSDVRCAPASYPAACKIKKAMLLLPLAYAELEAVRSRRAGTAVGRAPAIREDVSCMARHVPSKKSEG